MFRVLIELQDSGFIMLESSDSVDSSRRLARFSTETETIIFPSPGSPMDGTSALRRISLYDAVRLSARDGYTQELPLIHLVGSLKCTPLGRIGSAEVSLLR